MRLKGCGVRIILKILKILSKGSDKAGALLTGLTGFYRIGSGDSSSVRIILSILKILSKGVSKPVFFRRD